MVLNDSEHKLLDTIPSKMHGSEIQKRELSEILDDRTRQLSTESGRQDTTGSKCQDRIEAGGENTGDSQRQSTETEAEQGHMSYI